MKNFFFARRTPASQVPPTQARALAPQKPAPEETARPTLDQRFLRLLSLYRGTGGMARFDEVAHVFNRRHAPGMDALTRWIASRHVIGFEWRGELWLPLFQFTGCDLMPSSTLQPVLAELNPLLDPLSLAEWFARPHALLGNNSPVQVMLGNPCSVLAAARVDKTMAQLRHRRDVEPIRLTRH